MPFLKKPRTLLFTPHSHAKMRQYGLSEARVKRIIHSPKRIEEGIMSGTLAMMQKAGSEKHPHELWVMTLDEENERRVISAWRYPGETKPGEPLPAEILREMQGWR